MAQVLSAEACCGLRELDGLSRHTDPNEAMMQVAENMYGSYAPKGVNPYAKPDNIEWSRTIYGDRYWMRNGITRIYEYQINAWGANDSYDKDSRWRYAVFTQAGSRRTYGKRFAALIAKEGLGEVVQATTKTVKNPNSGNVLKAWIWTVNHTALKKWAQARADKLAAKETK